MNSNYKKLQRLKKTGSNTIHVSEHWNPKIAELDKHNYKSVKAKARFKRPAYYMTCSGN